MQKTSPILSPLGLRFPTTLSIIFGQRKSPSMALRLLRRPVNMKKALNQMERKGISGLSRESRNVGRKELKSNIFST